MHSGHAFIIDNRLTAREPLRYNLLKPCLHFFGSTLRLMGKSSLKNAKSEWLWGLSMKQAMIRVLLAVYLPILLLATACSRPVAAANQLSALPESTETGAESTELIISVASSLRDVMISIQADYARLEPDVQLIFNYGSSGALYTQIEQGAPIDVYISAAKKYMDLLASNNKIIPETRRDLLGNQLVVITPPGSSVQMEDLWDIASSDCFPVAVGDFKSVPAGQYAQEALKKSGVLEVLNAGDRLVFAKDVLEILSWVETGNAHAGIVFRTDALSARNVQIAFVVSDLEHDPIVYPSAVLCESRRFGAATDFINYLYSHDAGQIFKSHGFDYLAE